MNILHLTRDFPPNNNGGISTSVGRLVTALEYSDVRCTVVSFDDWRPKNSGQDKGSFRTEGNVFRVSTPQQWQELQKQHALTGDVIHVHDAMLWQAGQSLTGKRLFSVHVLQAKMNEIRAVQTTLSSRAEAEAIIQADWLHFPSQASLEQAQHFYPSLPPTTVIGWWPPVTTHFSATAIEKDASFQVELLYVGRFDRAKGSELLIDIINELPDNWRLTIIGGLPASPRNEQIWLQRLAVQGKKNVRYLGWLTGEELVPYYQQADILVQPSRFETFGLTAIEAMAHETAVVVFQGSGGLLKVSEGAHIAVADSQQFITQLWQLGQDSVRLAELKKEAAQMVNTRYDWRHGRDRFRLLYRQITGLR